jgi:hypothetical protein
MPSGAQASNANFQVTLFTGTLRSSAARRFRIGTLTLSLVLVALLSWYVVREAFISTSEGEAIFVGARQFYVWLQRIVVATGLSLLSVQLVSDLLRTIFSLGPPPLRKEGGPSIA